MALYVFDNCFLVRSVDLDRQDVREKSLVLQIVDNLIVIEGNWRGVATTTIDDARKFVCLTQSAARTLTIVTAYFRNAKSLLIENPYLK